ncbi:pyridoxamine 5'-phosphate oxidase family protein [Streptantibioticus ferralitis]|uniref:Pyridoxamine 5'-phosphate oxidase family protein n=1 Tax=Streptantibioticus ferralitis TaxID=236510 RepID=A0ABT5Z643_9ACTN|nr:pyridoxamine 5'-phosphate oxidase family protein [Streptantibioticus ferralitis]MDF2259021.1 pyridoxamine 5'-phosphate oxidase family protein [Streptantibioticus ferralitis]
MRPGSDGEHQIQRELGTVARADRFYEDQVRDRLNAKMREFTARQEMLFVSTADRKGECDSSFRAGPPGFIQVLDDKTVAYPEYRGNGVMASLGNIQENPHIGILMIDFARDRIGLHINGRARLVPDDLMRAAHPELPVDPVPGRRAQVWVEVTVVEAYIHCSKHIPRLVKAPLRAGAPAADGEQAWGTDDVKRKGGDYFGTAAQAREARRASARTEAEPSASPRSLPLQAPPELAEADRERWRREAERALTEARQRVSAEAPGAPGADQQGGFDGWFG